MAAACFVVAVVHEVPSELSSLFSMSRGAYLGVADQ